MSEFLSEISINGEVPCVETEIVYPGNFEILKPRDFFQDFHTRSRDAKARVMAQSMYAEYGETFNSMAATLLEAKQRGLDTALNLDYYTYLVEGQNIYLFSQLNPTHRSEARARMRSKIETIDFLERAGIDVTITNPPSVINNIVPFKGRNHTKLAVVDNTAWVGGLSYRDDDLDKIDFMMRFTDPAIVSVLADQFGRVNADRLPHDQIIPCNQETFVMVDRGNPGDSVILSKALFLIQNAQSDINLITQYTPNGVITEELYKAYCAGIDVKIFTSATSSISEWFGKVLDVTNRTVGHLKRSGLPHLRSTRRVHAKGLVVDSDISGQSAGIIGSHNLIESGVMLGTEELSVCSSNPQFVYSLAKYFNDVEREIVNGSTI